MEVNMSSWHSYNSIYNLGHRALTELFSDNVLVEEKIDGSQFSFGKFIFEDGNVCTKCRSKGCEINVDYPEKMFNKAVENIKPLDLKIGWTYRSEYLQKAKHNTLAYDRTPEKNLIIFDIATDEECYLSYDDKVAEAKRIGLEVVPNLYFGKINDPRFVLDFLSMQSILGGQKIEGVVIKNYNRFGPDKKTLMGKYVSEAFKEVHNCEWKKENPAIGDIVDNLISKYKTPARWQKAVQHLKENGLLTGSPKDIGILMKEVQIDIEKECIDEIKDSLYNWAKSRLLRSCVHGLPEWYKEQLLKLQFEK
jgi:hypothetical protein